MRMKKLLLFVLLSCLSLTVGANTYYKVIDGLVYYLNDAEGEMTATVADDAKYSQDNDYVAAAGPAITYSGAITIPATVTYDAKVFSVTGINGNAFNGRAITSVSIGSNVKRIWKDAFAKCNNLKKATFASLSSLCSIWFENANSNPLSMAHNLYIGEATSAATELNLTGINSIGQYAFSGCWGVTTVRLSEDVTTIGTDAFKDCKDLTKTVFASVPALFAIDFANEAANPLSLTKKLYFSADSNAEVTNLTIATKTEEQKDIRKYALVNASSMVKVTIPANITTIGADAFKGCTALVNADFDNLNQVLTMAYENTASNPLSFAKNLMIKGVVTTQITVSGTTVGARAFYNCRWLESVLLDNTVTSIGDEAFRNCSNLSAINLPTQLVSIGERAFFGCPITSITLPATLTSIGMEAFRDTRIAQVVIPDGVTSGHLGDGVFSGCSYLKKVVLPAGLESIPPLMFLNCSNLTDITLPDGVKTINERAFEGCAALKTMPASSSLQFIMQSAFAKCTGLTNLVLTAPLEAIYKSAFQGCSNITSVTLPASLTNILSTAFSGCTKLTDIYSNCPAAPTAAADAFDSPASITLHKVDAATGYDAEPWKSMKQAAAAIANYTLTFVLNDNEEHPYKTISRQAGLPIGSDEVTAPDGIFSGWDKEIPQVMPSEDVTFYGYTSVKKTIDGLSYHLYPAEAHSVPAKENRAVLIAGLDGKYSAETITVPATVTDNTVVYPVTAVEASAFDGCETVYRITLPASVKEIGTCAFRRCKKLIQINIPETVTVISDELFRECTDLSANPLHDGIKEIGQLAFCATKFSAKTLPTALKKVGWQAFRECNSLTEITVPQLDEIGTEVFLKCAGLTKVVFADGFSQKLPERTFQECKALEDVTLQGSMNIVDAQAFLDCSALKVLTVPEGITVIGNSAFGGCTGLTTLTLPSTVTSLGDKALNSCTALSQLTVNATNAPGAVENTFASESYATTNVYVNNVSNYTGNPWNKFTHLQANANYTLTYKLDGVVYVKDDVEQVFTKRAGEVVDAMADPEKEGREFSGWKSEPEVMPAEDVTVTGGFKYEVKYYDGAVDEAKRLLKDQQFQYFYGEEIVVPTESLAREGSIFALPQDMPATMPASDLNVVVAYSETDRDEVINGFTYRLFFSEDEAARKAELKKVPTTIASLTIPATVEYNGNNYKVTAIQKEAAMGCTLLETVAIEASLESIDDQAFENCTKLKTITLPNSLKRIGYRAFYGTALNTTVVIPASVTELGDYIFYWCTNLKGVDFDATVTAIPAGMFKNCSAMTTFEMPDNIKVVGSDAFNGCASLTTLTLSSALQSIGDNALGGCAKLTALTLPATVAQLGKGTFNGCPLESVTLEGPTLPAAYETTFDANAYNNATLLTTITEIPSADPCWSKFVNVENGGAAGEPCAKPTITYKTGKLTFACATEGATIVAEVKVPDVQKQNLSGEPKEINLTRKYVVEAYAIKNGMKKSATTTFEYDWKDTGDMNDDGEVDTQDAIRVIEKYLNKE